MKCHKCGSESHLKRDCPQNKGGHNFTQQPAGTFFQQPGVPMNFMAAFPTHGGSSSSSGGTGFCSGYSAAKAAASTCCAGASHLHEQSAAVMMASEGPLSRVQVAQRPAASHNFSGFMQVQQFSQQQEIQGVRIQQAQQVQQPQSSPNLSQTPSSLRLSATSTRSINLSIVLMSFTIVIDRIIIRRKQIPTRRKGRTSRS